MTQPKQRSSQISFFEIRRFLKELQGRAMDRHGKPAQEFELHFEGEDVVRFLRMIHAAEYHLHNYEIRRIDD